MGSLFSRKNTDLKIGAIIHLTDLHFGKAAAELFKDSNELAESIFLSCGKKIENIKTKVLVVSGDLVFCGKMLAYEDAKRLIRKLCSLFEIEPENTIMCPGNHDIISSKDGDRFEGINKLIFELTKKSSLLFKDQTNFRYQLGAFDFLVLNSAYHKDPSYGLVDLDSLPNRRESKRIKIVVVHHNLLNIYQHDTSTIRNAYRFLMKLIEDKVHLVLHGHQHFLEIFPIGNHNCLIVGAGSLNYKMDDGRQNQFNLILFDSGRTQVCQYLYIPDLGLPGKVGGWKELDPYELRK